MFCTSQRMQRTLISVFVDSLGCPDFSLVYASEDSLMAKSSLLYGVLKGTVVGLVREPDDDHYQIRVSTDTTTFRIAVNVKSSLTPPDLLFQRVTFLPAPLTRKLAALPRGFKKLISKPGGLLQDFVRGGVFQINQVKVTPSDVPAVGTELKNTIEDAVAAAENRQGSVLYAFGAKWGPLPRKHRCFQSTGSKRLPDAPLNCELDKSHSCTAEIYHDGCLIFQYPDCTWRAFFLLGLPIAIV